MKKLNWDLLQVTKHNKDGAYGTQADRWHALDLMAKQLEALGYKNMRATSLKQRHVEALVTLWQNQELTTATLKNRMAQLRWWAEKIGNPSAVPRNNKALGIPDRRYVTNENKAQTLDRTRLALVNDPRVRLCLELQESFGVRREEAIKFQPRFSDHGTELVLKPSTTKGGRGRTIPIRTEAQRELDREARLQVSEELGHGRTQISANYLGS